MYTERVSKLPLKYEALASDIASGLVYWHGRDVRREGDASKTEWRAGDSNLRNKRFCGL